MNHIDPEFLGDATSLPDVVNWTPLSERLTLQRTGTTLTGHPPQGFDQRLYGGHLLAQVTLAAAAHAQEGRVVDSLHLYFLRPGRPAEPIDYTVRSIRSGRIRSVLDVRATQGPRELLSAVVALAPPSTPAVSAEAPDAPPPESLPTLADRRKQDLPADGVRLPPLGDWRTASRPLDVRPVDDPLTSQAPTRRLWLRAEPDVEADDHMQRAILAFASDRSLVPVIARARGERAEHPRPSTSVDHAMWFHATPRAGDWYLYAQDCPSAHPHGGLARGVLFDRDGRTVASVQQHAITLD